MKPRDQSERAGLLVVKLAAVIDPLQADASISGLIADFGNRGLNSPEYATDFNETKTWGAATGSPRRPEDSELAVFWSGNGTLYWIGWPRISHCSIT